MPLIDGVFERIWNFVDRFTTDDAVRRSDIDTALEDIEVGMNSTIELLQGEIGERVTEQLFLGLFQEYPTESLGGSELVAGNSFILSPNYQWFVFYVYSGTEWHKTGEFETISQFFQSLSGLSSAASFRNALGLGTAATMASATIATKAEMEAAKNATTNARSLHITGGSGNAFTIQATSTITTYTEGQAFGLVFDRAPNGASSLAVDGLNAAPLKRYDFDNPENLIDLAAGDIKAGTTNTVVYDGTAFVLTGFLRPSEHFADLKADQAEAETGTSNDVYMTPLRTAEAIAALAPLQPRAAARFDGTGSVGTITPGFSSGMTVEKTATGKYTITLSDAIAGAAYAPFATAGNGAEDRLAAHVHVVNSTTFKIYVINHGNALFTDAVTVTAQVIA